MRHATILVAVLAIAPFTSVTAQEPPQAQRSQRAWCFRGRPLPTCRSFWITEAGYGYALTGSNRHYATWELGLMTNLDERWAVGGTFLAGIAFGDGARVGVGLKPRFRLWLDSSTSVELSPGVLLAGSEGQFPRFTGHVSVNFQDRLALTSQLEVLDNVAWYVGVKLGSKAGLIATGVEAAAPLVLVIAIIGWLVFP